MISVYIASPYTKGDVAENVKKSMEAANKLIDLGFVPFCPLLCHFLHMQSPKKYDIWMEQDLYWLERCDVVLRLPGESSGADEEVLIAEENNIPVFYDIDALLASLEVNII